MEINVNKERMLVEIWLSCDEREDPKLLERLKPVFGKYREEKFLVVLFESGKGDLYQETRDLLCYNRKRLAQLEARYERPC